MALGKTRAKQFALLKALERAGETECKPGDRVMCVQMHGDASFTGQGVVMEGLGLSMCRTPWLYAHQHTHERNRRQPSALYGWRERSLGCQVSFFGMLCQQFFLFADMPPDPP